MTAGNGRVVPTPGLSSKATGGVDPTAGTNAVAEGTVAPKTPKDASAYGVANTGNSAMQDQSGPGSVDMTMASLNADCSGNNSGQDMTGASLGAQTQQMNTADGNRWNQSWAGNDDRNANDMSSME